MAAQALTLGQSLAPQGLFCIVVKAGRMMLGFRRVLKSASCAILLGSSICAAGCAPAAVRQAIPPAIAQIGIRRHAAGEKLYIANSFYGYGSVYIFDYPSGAYVGMLSQPPEGSNAALGACKDTSGNLYFSNATHATVDEYTGQGNYLRTLRDPGQEPEVCSVSPKTGDLAVVNSVSNSGYPASISIFRHARGLPRVIRSEWFFTIGYVAYDDAGNLFFDGSEGPVGTDEYGEIPGGKASMKVVHLEGGIYPERLQFAGGRMAIESVHRKIYQAVGKEITGSTKLRDDYSGFFITGKDVITLNKPKKHYYRIQVYNYPAGGAPVRSMMLQHRFDRGLASEFVISR